MNNNRKIWENIYSNNDAGSYMRYPDSNLVALFFRFKNRLPSRNIAVLDFGCGSGNNTEFLSLYANEIYGIDISLSALQITKLRLKNSKIFNPNNFSTNIDNFKDKQFDLIVAWQSLYYNTKKTFLNSFNNLFEKLKKGGLFIITLLTPDDIKIKSASCYIEGSEIDCVISNVIPAQEGCIIFAPKSYEQLLSLFDSFNLTILDYGKFSFFSKKNHGINEYWLVGKKNG